MTSEKDIQRAIGMALLMYADEPCRICGKLLSLEDVKDGAVFAGYADDNLSRSAHRRCWEGMVSVARDYFNKYGHSVEAVDWEAVREAERE
jgi:hypothetical protein